MKTLNELVDRLISCGVLKTPAIIRVFETVDRKDFVHLIDKDNVYEDYPLPIGYGATISQPYTVAFMLELLQPKRGDKILDIGTGSGWTTALLAKLAGKTGHVIGVERVPELVEFGKANITKYNFPQAHIKLAGSTLGAPEDGPFDKILVSAAARVFPEELISQLNIGGCLVIPINQSIWRIDKSSENTVSTKEFPGFVFVTLQ